MKSIKSGKSIEILKKMDESDRKSFAKWLASPWCNSTKKLVMFLAELTKFHPDYEDPKLTRERLFKKMFPGKKNDVRLLDNLFWELNRQAERFLSFSAFEKSDFDKKFHLSQALQERSIEKRFFKISESAIDDLEKKMVKDWEDENLLLRFRLQSYHHPDSERQTKSNTLIEDLDNGLELTYLLQKAILINEKFFRNRVLKNEPYEISNDLENWMLRSEKIDHPSIRLFRLRFSYSEENLLSQYYLIYEDYFKDFDRLNSVDQKIHMLSLVSDSTNLHRKGLIDLSETLPLFKLGLTSGLLIENDRLDRVIFVMIVSAANLKRDFEFTRHFVKEYTKFLPDKIREDGKHYALAHIANREKKLEKCIDILLSHQFKARYFQLATRILTLQTYFDLLLINSSYEPMLASFCESFDKWLRRDKTRSDKNKAPILNFIQKTRRLVRIYLEPEFDEQDAQKLLEGNLNVQPINWLFEKRDQIVTLRKK